MRPCDQCAAGCTTLAHTLNGLDLQAAVDQPPIVEMETVDGVFIKQMYIAKTGTLIPQHSHGYEHSSLLAYGSVRVWRDGELDDDYAAPAILVIPAGVKHTFMSLEDGTTLYCIHNISRTGHVEVREEHQLIKED